MKKRYLRELRYEVGLLGDRLDRIDDHLRANLVPMSMQLSRIESSNVATIKAIVDRLARIEANQVEILKYAGRTTSDQLDRGQTASALHGLTKRIDSLASHLTTIEINLTKKVRA
jgi:hypothetical protein